MVSDRHLRDASDLLQAVTEVSLAQLDGIDRPAARLAVEYARIIDSACENPVIVGDLGPKLLACLESLGATPLGRAKMKGTAADGKQGQLSQLRAARK